MSVIRETERLLLRHFTGADGEKLYFLNLDPDVIKFTGDPPFSSIEHARQFLINYQQYEQFGMGRYAVILKEDESFLGWCGLKQHDTFVDLGFRLFKKHWNNGYATEAARACLEHGFEDLSLNEIVARIAPDNQASVNVIEKLGMKFWKKEECNGFENSLYYRLSKEDWLKS